MVHIKSDLNVAHYLPDMTNNVPGNSRSSILLPSKHEEHSKPDILIFNGAPFKTRRTLKSRDSNVPVRASWRHADHTCGRTVSTNPEAVSVMGDMVISPMSENLIINDTSSGMSGWLMASNFKLKMRCTHLEMLPEEILLKIFIYLSALDGIRLGSVSKQWQEIKRSCTQLISFDNEVVANQPWYYMFKAHFPDGHPSGCAYDSDMKTWHAYDFPWPKSYSSSCDSTFDIFHGICSSSNGLVCIMNNNRHSDIFIYNPMFKCGRMLPRVPNKMIADPYRVYRAIISVDIKDKTYMVAMVGSTFEIDKEKVMDIYLYESKKGCWTKLFGEKMFGVVDGYRCFVICNNVLHFVMSFSNMVGSEEDYLDVESDYQVMVSYELSEQSISGKSLMETAIKAPSAFEFVSLMNLANKLVMVGKEYKFEDSEDREILKEIGIFELCNNEWKEVAKMPHTYVEDFKDTCFVINSVGSGQFIYMHPYESTLLVIFDFNRKIWERVDGHVSLEPISNRTVFSGFCFEPRLDILP